MLQMPIAVELIRPDSTGSKRPSFQEPPFQPPQMKKLAVPSDSGTCLEVFCSKVVKTLFSLQP